MRVVAELPMSYPGERMEGCDTFLFPVRIESKEYMFSVDTGATNTILNSSLKPLMGELVEVRKPDYSFHQTPLEYHKTKRPLKIGNVSIRGTVALKEIDKQTPGCGIDGILGQDVMEQFIVQIDFRNKLFKLLKEFSPDVSIRKNWGIQVPLKRDLHGFYCIELKLIDGLYENFILDSGILGHGLLREEVFDILKNEGQFAEIISNGHRCIALPEACIDECKVSNLGFIACPDLKLPAGRSMLGTQFLSRFKMITIDLSKGEIYLSPF
ncbi:MAG: hypothetical protein OEV87_07540 [Phycisphaerae bacterium]|nr:hypothetical protein [Phycisphaerae bacterium]